MANVTQERREEIDKTRELVVEYLELLEREATVTEIIEYVDNWVPGQTTQGVGQILRWMRRDGLVDRLDNGNYALPKKGGKAFNANPDTEQKKDIAPFFRKAAGTTILLQQSPIELVDVISMSLRKRGVEFKFPLQSNTVRVDLGPSIPQWSPKQVTEYEINAIIVVYRSGERQEFPVNSENPITFDSE